MEKITMLCYAKCTTCQKAEKWLQERGIAYDYRPIKEQNPTVAELTQWIEQSGMLIKKFFNTSGLLYKAQNIKDKINVLPNNELIQILSSDGMMVKRPLVLAGNKILLGFKEDEWSAVLAN